MAQNGVQYIFAGDTTDTGIIVSRATHYLSLLEQSQAAITAQGKTVIRPGQRYLTHCHASTVTQSLIAAHTSGTKFSVICTETRPKYQGRITATELSRAGIETTMVVDSAAPYLLSSLSLPIDAVFIGADLLTGPNLINKIGTYGICLAAAFHHIPVYCFSTLLKFHPQETSFAMLEKRDPKEIWTTPPKNVSFITPAFDITPFSQNISFVTESGILPGSEITSRAIQTYPFLKE